LLAFAASQMLGQSIFQYFFFICYNS